MSYNDAECLNIDLFAGDTDDAGATLCSSKIVTTRKTHTCRFADDPHNISIGARARVETALIDNHWTTFYVCCDCLIKCLEDFE